MHSLNDEETVLFEMARKTLPTASFDWVKVFYRHMETTSEPFAANIAEIDRFFLLTQVLRRPDAYNEWLYKRCREVEAAPDGHIDLWAREHYKSTIITFAGSMQEIIKDPEITIGIFSHTKSIAKTFVDQIKQECEQNEQLHILWPDIFWENPKREAPTWSLDGGIVVKRTTNPREKTVEGHGLVDGQPISKHFGLMIYDDVVTEESVYTPEKGMQGIMNEAHLVHRNTV
jgi:hypothetical protein